MGLRTAADGAASGRTGDPTRRREASPRGHGGPHPLTQERATDHAPGRLERTLPTGTITFLFSDIEGSTRLTERLGPQRYGDVLALQRMLLREAFGRHGGVEVGTEGDSFFVVFEDVGGALAAAVDGQRALAGATWPHDTDALRVRMGLHTGEGALAAGTYVGASVNRAARIAATAHGGQVVVSATTRRLAEAGVPAGVRLRDLGEHRLKDLAEPERIAELVIAGLPSEFPPLRSLEAVPHNLPAQVTSFVGRHADVVAVSELLRTARLVTMTGPGGTGKTRLGLQVAAESADRYPDGVWFVPLSPISDPTLVDSTIATALGLRAAGARPIADTLVEHLRDKEALLVLDNFEQVADAAPLVAAILREAPRVRVLATSRIVLRLSGEHEYPLDALASDDGIRLFLERARAVRPDFSVNDENAAAIAEIVARLDGLPLAIELAAARSRLLAPGAMLARLDRRLDLLASDLRDLPDRQRTIRGAIDWSHDLLSDGPRRSFGRLAVLVGGGTLDDIEAVLGGLGPAPSDVLGDLEALVEHSLLRRVDGTAGLRFTMLAVIREYATEKLVDSGDERPVRDRHAAHFLSLAEDAAPQLTGPDQLPWLDRLDADRDNLRAAIAHAIEVGDVALALRLCAALWRFWQIRGYLSEGIERTVAALALPGVDDHPAERLAALDAAGGLAWWLGDYEACERYYRQALEGHLAAGADDRTLAGAYYNLSFPEAFIGRPDEAALCAREARDRYERIGDEDGVARVHWGMAIFALSTGDLETAGREADAADAYFRGRALPFDLGWALFARGQVAFKGGDMDAAEQAWLEALRIFRSVSDAAGTAMLLDGLAAVAGLRGDHERAARLAGTVARLQRTGGAGLIPLNRVLRGYDPLPLRADPELGAVWDEGEALATEDAVAFALREVPS